MWNAEEKYDGKVREKYRPLRRLLQKRMGKDVGKNKNSTKLVSSKYEAGPSSLEEEEVSDNE